MRVLQVLWDGGGNVPVQLLVSRELMSRGHRVRVLGHRRLRETFEAAGASFGGFEQAPQGDSRSAETDLIRDWEARTPIGAFARTRDNLMFGPALRFARDVMAELEREPADVVAYDYLLVGAGIGAEGAGVPAAAIVHTVYPLPTAGVPPFGDGLMPAKGPFGRLRDATLARVFDRCFAPGLKTANAARDALGLEPLDHYAGQYGKAARVLVMTSPRFDWATTAVLPDNVRYAGAALDRGSTEVGWEPPWHADDKRPLVLASFSTSFQDQTDLVGRVMDAVDGMPVRVALTAGPALDMSRVRVPDNVAAFEFVPHRAVLRDANLTICHAGLGTVHASLAHGVPLVCIPDGRDQNDTAARVVAAAVGVRLPRRARPERIRAAVRDALGSDSTKAVAGSFAETLAEEDGAAAVADELEAVASAGRA